MNVRQYKSDCLAIARDSSPYDSGNLRFNATNSYDIVNGFAIKISGALAYYWVFLNKGTKNSKLWVGYFDNIKTQIETYINDKGNSKYNNITATKSNLSKLSPNSLKRERILRNSLSFTKRKFGGD